MIALDFIVGALVLTLVARAGLGFQRIALSQIDDDPLGLRIFLGTFVLALSLALLGFGAVLCWQIGAAIRGLL